MPHIYVQYRVKRATQIAPLSVKVAMYSVDSLFCIKISALKSAQWEPTTILQLTLAKNVIQCVKNVMIYMVKDVYPVIQKVIIRS